MSALRSAFFAALVAAASSTDVTASNGPEPPLPARGEVSYADIVLADKPVAYWRFDDSEGGRVPSHGTGPSPLEGSWSGSPQLVPGPRPPRHRSLELVNRAGAFGSARVVVADPGTSSPLDFDLGDTVALEAWVSPAAAGPGRHVYVVGKGRTGDPAWPAHNQNWSLRLTGRGDAWAPSFLFRSDRERTGEASDWHRWTASRTITVGSGWHHLALHYSFGDPESLRAWIDGEPVDGVWDMGGATSARPVIDDDAVWIGASLAGQAGSAFPGRIDEVAIHRRPFTTERVRARVADVDHDAPVESDLLALSRPRREELPPPEDPDGAFLVQVLEGPAQRDSWLFPSSPLETDRFRSTSASLSRVPRKYDDRGLIADRSSPFVIRLSGRVAFGPGARRLLLRAFNSARLVVDGRELARTPFLGRNASGHEPVPETAPSVAPGLRALPVGHSERVVELADGPAMERHVVVEAIVGGAGLRAEIGELAVAVAGDDGAFRLLGDDTPLTDAGWRARAREDRIRIADIEAAHRSQTGASERAYWRRRHELARASVPPRIEPAHRTVDRLLDAALARAGVEPLPPVDDATFLRRLSLDARGRIPGLDEIVELLADTSPGRRGRWIDRLLADSGFADHQVGYWQDVLAENPGILKPKLNNSGPFRWWLHDSLLDRKPFDRLVTELVRMEGSVHAGGPAGFALATQNDVPMAAKAHILGTAFLGVQLKCARCHDAPYHPWKQRDLFELAALLAREPVPVPASSSVPRSPEELAALVVDVTLEPGSSVAPRWPFPDLVPRPPSQDLLRGVDDPRERAALWITAPENRRFPQVLANRAWKMVFGYGLVEPVDDWSDATPSHPELLEFLGEELVRRDYDLSGLLGVLFRTRAYARSPWSPLDLAPGAAPEPSERLFPGPARRRMRAEQILDSLFTAAGKEFGSEELNLDLDGRRPVTTFLNLGTPRRAWELTSLSNERDRPALSMPVAQSLTDVLKTFGWRETRQDPITDRDEVTTPLQPLILANGVVAGRIATLSDDSAFTALALSVVSLDELIDGVVRRVLTRAPTSREKALFASLLRDGFETRTLAVPAVDDEAGPESVQRHGVSWSNHLSAEATRIKLELERAARLGDPPTRRLEPDWRERLEDVIWALINSPEFLFVP